MTIAVRRYIRLTQVLRILLSGDEIDFELSSPSESALLSKLLSRYQVHRLVSLDPKNGGATTLRCSSPKPPSESPYVGRADRAPAPEQLWVRICITYTTEDVEPEAKLTATVRKKRVKPS